jgi:hypothetical protein
MKTDITRDTFNPLKHFSRVLSQQGRVQLDADWNEQVSILLHYLHTLTADLVGPGAGPEAKCGFDLLNADADIDALKLSPEETSQLKELLKKEHLLIGTGRYYVDGVQVENEKVVPFFDQPGWATPWEDRDDIQEGKIKPALVYLDAWERHVTPIEDDDIREKALGGPDTATRAKIAWVVRARKMTDDESKHAGPPTKIEELREAFAKSPKPETSNRGLLQAQVTQHKSDDDPCSVTPESVYRGVENQLYRVEIHRSGAALGANKLEKTATFKWSRDNGSVAASWLETDGDVLKVTPLHDAARGFSKGQWVELHDDRRELEGRKGTLVQLTDVEAGSLTIDPLTAAGSLDRSEFKIAPKVRRWDQSKSETIKLDEGAVPIEEGKWIEIEDGVEVQFQASPDAAKPHRYRTGDYWLIPARVATRNVEWPLGKNDEPLALPPHGVTHHYALLGLLAVTPPSTLEFTDCRRKFPPLKPV